MERLLFRTVFQNVAGLAVQGLADGFHGRKPYGLGLAAFEDGEVGWSYADFFSELAGRHLPARQHYVNINYYRHSLLLLLLGLFLFCRGTLEI